jgi:hypothetical protein
MLLARPPRYAATSFREVVSWTILMHNIQCWDDLRLFGSENLTRAACGLFLRVLCDVTQRGKQTNEKSLKGANLGLRTTGTGMP